MEGWPTAAVAVTMLAAKASETRTRALTMAHVFASSSSSPPALS